MYEKKRLKKDNNIINESIISFNLVLIINSRLFTGKKPPDEIKVNERLNELKNTYFKTLFYSFIRIEINKIG